MAPRHIDKLKALSVPGTWRYVLTQPLSFWLLCFYLFIEYIRPQAIWPVLDILPWGQTSIIATAVALLLDGKKPAIPTVAGVALLAFTAVLLLSSVTAYSPEVSYSQLEIYLQFFIVIILMINIVTTESRFVVFMLLFLLCSFKMSQAGFRTFVERGGSFAGWGATGGHGPFQNSGEFGIQMCVFVPLAAAFLWSLWDRWPRWKQIIMALLPITGLVSIVASSSRGALVGIAVVALWWMVMINRRKRIKGVITLAVVSSLVFLLIPEGSKDRFETAGDDETSTQRLVRWEEGIEMARDRPLLGVGYANWTVYHRDHFPPGEGSLLAHNIFVQVGAELGYIGLLGFLLMIGAKLSVNRQTRKLARETPGDNRFTWAMAHGLDCAMIGYLASGFFVTVFFYLYFWINLGMTIALHRSARHKRSEAGSRRSRPVVAPVASGGRAPGSRPLSGAPIQGRPMPYASP